MPSSVRVYHSFVNIGDNIHLRNDCSNNVISFNQVIPRLRRIVISHNYVLALRSKMFWLPTNKTGSFFLKRRIRSRSTWDGIRRSNTWVIMFVLFLIVVINFVDILLMKRFVLYHVFLGRHCFGPCYNTFLPICILNDMLQHFLSYLYLQ